MLADGSARRSVPVGPLLWTLAAVVAGVWWLWPTLTDAEHDVDVLVVGDGMLAEARRSIELRFCARPAVVTRRCEPRSNPCWAMTPV